MHLQHLPGLWKAEMTPMGDTGWVIDVLSLNEDIAAFDPQVDYPPPLRRPTEDRSYPPVDDPDFPQVTDTHPTTQEAE